MENILLQFIRCQTYIYIYCVSFQAVYMASALLNALSIKCETHSSPYPPLNVYVKLIRLQLEHRRSSGIKDPPFEAVASNDHVQRQTL